MSYLAREHAEEHGARYARTLKQVAKSKRATSAGHAEGEVTYKYHDTIVFRYYVGSMDVEIDFGGYDTQTTRRRINEAFDACDLPAQLHRDKGQTWLHFRLTDERWPIDNAFHFKTYNAYPGTGG